MTDLSGEFAAATDMIDRRSVDVETSFELRDLLAQIEGLVSTALEAVLAQLSDDPSKNDERLRERLNDVATKAFFAGYFAHVAEHPGAPSDEGVVVRCSPGELEAIGLSAIRDGVLTFHLVSDHEPGPDEQHAPDHD